MAANNMPMFPSGAAIGFCKLTGNIGNPKNDGTGVIGTNMFVAFTAGAKGAFVYKIRVIGVSSAAATLMATSAIRFFLSTQASGSITISNAANLGELGVGGITAAHSTQGINFIELPLGIKIAPNYNILASINDNITANTSWSILTFAGNY